LFLEHAEELHAVTGQSVHTQIRPFRSILSASPNVKARPGNAP
jgi:hypothetical protein